MLFNPERLNEIKANLITMATTFGHEGNVQKMHACSTAAMHCELAVTVMTDSELVTQGELDDNARDAGSS